MKRPRDFGIFIMHPGLGLKFCLPDRRCYQCQSQTTVKFKDQITTFLPSVRHPIKQTNNSSKKPFESKDLKVQKSNKFNIIYHNKKFRICPHHTTVLIYIFFHSLVPSTKIQFVKLKMLIHTAESKTNRSLGSVWSKISTFHIGLVFRKVIPRPHLVYSFKPLLRPFK